VQSGTVVAPAFRVGLPPKPVVRRANPERQGSTLSGRAIAERRDLTLI
jgi:hypothetical protein